MPSPKWLLAAVLWPAPCTPYAVRKDPVNSTGGGITPVRTHESPLLAERDDSSDVSFGFVQRWAAIGDSFTAGIGSGNQLGQPPVNSADWMCSRYSYTWPQIVDRYIGPSKKDFQYPACSGDRSEGIYKQAQNLQGNLDLVMMTAGGNDLCLAAMIRVCVILPYSGEDACTSIINKAQENINTILKDNIRSILDALKPKMKANGIVIYNGYAPFFNAANEDCGDSSKQVWAFPQYWSWRYWLSRGLTLTIDRRQKFNTLVGNINGAIKDVVKEFQVDGAKKYDIEFSDWSGWPAEVDGEMCSPSSDGHYPDPNQPELQFFKPNTYVQKWTERDGLKKRDAAEEDVEAHLDEARERFKRELNLNLYDSLLYKSPDPRAAALHKLDSRAPSPPNCPGDGSFDPTLGLGLPDTFGRIFHPNEKGHETIAAFALQNLAYVRNFQLGKGAAVCEVPQDDFVCWRQVERRKAFVSWARLDVNYRDFCNSVTVPGNTVNWRFAKTYHPGTPEEVEFVLQLSKGAATYDKAACLESLDRVINSCDGNDPENPMNWKFGGKWVRGGYSWEIHPKKDRELHKRPDGSCQGWYKWALSAYTIYGKGWAGWDWGQETLLPNARSCVANSLTRWEFGYFDNPAEHDGWEWWSTFNTMIGVSGRCFDNLKVVGAAGGYTHRWEDNFADERYENYGCAGSWGS